MVSHNLYRRGGYCAICSLMLIGMLVLISGLTNAYPAVALGKQTTVGMSACGEYATIYGEVVSTTQEYAGPVAFDYLINESYYFGTDPGTVYVYFNLTDSTGTLISSSGIVYPTITYHDVDFMNYNYTFTYSDGTFPDDGLYMLYANCVIYYSADGTKYAFPSFKMVIDVGRAYVPMTEMLDDWWGGMGALLMIFGIGFVIAFGNRIETIKLLIISGSMILFGGIFVWTFWIGG